MKPDRWQLLKSILDAAVEMPPEAREDFIGKRCAGDPSLRDELQSLLSASEEASEFLEGSLTPSARLRVAIGERVGPYRVTRSLGEGGMGEVYEAMQETPVERRVALKLVKLGLDTRRVLARFESERHALALMNHRNIARVLDAGSTDEGRPYFVMELVDGVPITDYCDRKRLGIRSRLDVFLQVCGGVHHAHQKAIIHRDLKPSNILVIEPSGRPMPKIIDFGIAKAAAQQLTDGSLFTELGQVIGTPEYMSPEQAGLGGLDIDTRSDVYALGVLLYELLVGARPFESDSNDRVAFDELHRRIREEDPAAPSARFASLGEASEAIAEKRSTDVGSLQHALRGELDWMVLKALEKERSRRYSDATSLAADIGRYLRHEPVAAGPTSNAYRMKKFVRRHRVGVAATLLVGVSLLLGVSVATVGVVRATRAEAQARMAAERANREAEVAQHVSDFVVGLFELSDPREARGPTTASEVLRRGSERLESGASEDPLVRAKTMDLLGNVYHNLGMVEEAEPLLTTALEARERALGGEHLEVAESLDHLGALYRSQGRLDEWERRHRRALAIRERLLGVNDPLVVETRARLVGGLGEAGREPDTTRVERKMKRTP